MGIPETHFIGQDATNWFKHQLTKQCLLLGQTPYRSDRLEDELLPWE